MVINHAKMEGRTAEVREGGEGGEIKVGQRRKVKVWRRRGGIERGSGQCESRLAEQPRYLPTSSSFPDSAGRNIPPSPGWQLRVMFHPIQSRRTNVSEVTPDGVSKRRGAAADINEWGV